MEGGSVLRRAWSRRGLLVVVLAALVGAGSAAATSQRSAPTHTVTRAPLETTTTPTTAPPTTTIASTSTSTPTATTAPAPTVPPTVAPAAGADGTTLLVWTSGGLPPGYAASLATIPQIRHHTVVHGDLVELYGSRAADGTVLDDVADGWAIPIDAFAVDPASYAAFAPQPDAAVLAALEPGGAVLTHSSALLRAAGPGAVLDLAGGSVTVTGVVADESAGGAEVVVHRDDAVRLGIGTERFLLVADTDRAATLEEIRRRTPAGEHLSLRSSAEARWLRHGDRVEPQALVKRAFGEFAFRDGAGRDIRIDPGWLAANIVEATVPLLGTITCHRAVVPAVRDAMAELERSGRGDTVQPQNYAGCHYPRRIAPGAGLSRHSWGIALDLNISSNPRGTFDSQDPALVAAMTTRGFSWGGEWEYPDPGHYEFTARPDP